MKICLATAELVPFSKTGGLGDVTAALAGVLHRQGHEVRVFSPFYSAVETAGRTFSRLEEIGEISLPVPGGMPAGGGGSGEEEVAASLVSTPLPGSGRGEREDLEVYLVHCPRLYQRPGIYTTDPDEPLRFALLTRVVLEACRLLEWGPDVFHAHDWHTALLPLYLMSLYPEERLFSDSRTVLTLHNIGYQGRFSADLVEPLGLAGHRALLQQERLAGGEINFLETGVLWADLLTTVSETHGREIRTPEYGFGLDELLRRRSDRLVGIVNGIDTTVWNPAVDEHLPRTYDATTVEEGKRANRRHLSEALDLPFEGSVPLAGIVSRLTHQKGFDLAREPLPEALEAGALQLVVLGTGDEELTAFFRGLEERYPQRTRFLATYSESWAHRIEAAADLFLMPSRYEPCGLNQMYSQAYGTVPVVRKTGGLADTVEPWDPETGKGTGFVFEHADPQGLRWALGQAFEAWRDRDAWRRLRSNGMARDFSWERQGREYLELYRRLVEGPAGPVP